MEVGYKLKCAEDGSFNYEEYAKMAEFCRENNFEIEDKRPEYFEIVEAKKLSDEEIYNQKANAVRSIRSEYMSDTLNRVDRYERQAAIGVETTDSHDDYLKMLNYLEYLRNVPQSVDFPNIEVLTFDKWVEEC